jgi:glycosyltransferase involved in cell wall biosynthesis
MRLAIVSPFPPTITGIGQYGYHVSRALAQSGQFTRIDIAADKPKINRPILTPHNVRIQHVWHPNRLDTGWEILSFLKQLKPDLVWFNLDASVFGRSPLANLSGFLAPTGARKLGIPTIVTLHQLVELADLRALKAPGGALAMVGARLLTRVATQADVVCLTMRRYVDWLEPRNPRLRCLHIPLGAYHAPELLAEHEAPDLLLFGMLAPYKGLELLLEAFTSMKSRSHPNLRLTIAGTPHPRFPDYARQLQERVSGLDGIRWLGNVPEERVRELFHRAQVVVLPYAASVGSSSVLLQAATWGRSIVASDLPETQSMIRESDLDVSFFSRGNVESLSRVLTAQLDSPELRRRQTEHNFAAMRRFQPEDTCQAYLQAFNMALESRLSPKRIAIPALGAQVPTESI